MVACTGAVKQGPPGEKGDKGDPPAPTTPTDQTPPTGDPGVRMIKAIDPFIFNDSATGTMETEPTTIDLSGHFYPTTGLTYSVEGLTSAVSKRIDAMVVDENMLRVMLKSDAKNYENDKLKAKATAANGTSDAIEFEVRRNRSPRNAKGIQPGAADAFATEIVTRAAKVELWVGSQEEVTAKAYNLNDDKASGVIPIVIGKQKPIGATLGTHQEPFFFQDDGDNTLSFVSDLSVGQAKMLSITDGEMKVMLLGMKSTYYDANEDGTKTNNPITVDLLARDDGELDADDEEAVLLVYIDMAPTTTGNIGTKVITLGSTTDDMVAVPKITSYFNDDRHLSPQDITAGQQANLMYYVWSDKPEVASVSINPGNKDDVENAFVNIEDVIVNGFYVEGKGRGTAMIMVKAQQPPLPENDDVVFPTTGSPGTSGMKQFVTLSFMVEVK